MLAVEVALACHNRGGVEKTFLGLLRAARARTADELSAAAVGRALELRAIGCDFGAPTDTTARRARAGHRVTGL